MLSDIVKDIFRCCQIMSGIVKYFQINSDIVVYCQISSYIAKLSSNNDNYESFNPSTQNCSFTA